LANNPLEKKLKILNKEFDGISSSCQGGVKFVTTSGETTMMIPMVDLKRQYQTIRKDIDRAIMQVIKDSDFILGEKLQAFEKSFADFCECSHAVGVDSGTGALELALMAVGVKTGDEVIVPTFTFFSTASAVASLGAIPVFVDVEADTANIDPTKIEALITEKTTAIIPVHIFGQPANLSEILRLAKRHGLKVIEDAAQAHGAKLLSEGEWRTVGALGDIGCFSFYPGKNLGAYGDGGMVVTNSSLFAEKLALLRDFGRTGKYEHGSIGFNRRLDTMQAAVLHVKLKKLTSWNLSRQAHGALYDQLFKEEGIEAFTIRGDTRSVRHVYGILVPHRDELGAYLNGHGVATARHYATPLHLQPAFGYLGHQTGSFPVAEGISKRVLSLPIFPELREEEIRTVVRLIAKFYKNKLRGAGQ
jgi:dTDP-4-amino-4,6-dideoxygalactose transaminase